MRAPVRFGAARRGGAGLGAAVLGVTLLAGCADKEPQPATPAPAASPATPNTPATGGATTSPTAPATSTTTALPGMPTPLSVGDSPVDASRLRSIDDLPAVFGCPAAVTPIRLPGTPAPTGATGTAVPDAIVCASGLADKEALFLWYVPTPEAKLGALTAALDRARYVHAGPNWVAAGMINAQMGTVGGEVYR